MSDLRRYYIDRIIHCIQENELESYTLDSLAVITQQELEAIWDDLRWRYGDLAKYYANKNIDCLNCSNSFSDEDDALHCIVHNKIVDENDLCIDFNL